ncbi:MAG: MBL fold metallo-hydrolase [Hyphomicrobiaceae bacterium]|nr:MBL fold metallo-hydrolase [Hyphomicrobiaceae bacterium]
MSDHLSRRGLLASLAAAPLAAVPLAGMLTSTAFSKAPVAARTPPPLASIKVGRFEVIALNDGYADIPYGYFTGRPETDIEQSAVAALSARKTGLRIAFNQFLVRDGDQLILIDTGPAGNIGETGRLPSGLAALGLTPDDVDAVVLTHLHFDHISGLVTGGRKVFGNAEVYADRRDVDHWTDPAKRAAAPDFLKSSFDKSIEVVGLYPKLNRIDGEREISRGVSIVDLTGHTPGHIGVRIADGPDSLIMVSDMLFHPAIHPAGADIGFVFEQDAAAARQMRERFFPRAAEEKALIASTHMPFPGLGRIAKDRGELRWLSADWAHGD